MHVVDILMDPPVDACVASSGVVLFNRCDQFCSINSCGLRQAFDGVSTNDIA